MLRDPPPAAATLSICHASDNNVLSPQACSNTCWCDQLLANSCNSRTPRFWLCPENRPKSLVNIGSVNPAQISPIWPLPLFPVCFPPFTQSTYYLHISFSWLVSFYSLKVFFFAFFSTVLPFPWPLCSTGKLRLVYEVYTNIVHTPGTLSGLECDPAVWNLSLYAVFTGTYLCL